MTVSKLIEKLHRFDPNMPVVIRGISVTASEIELLKIAKMKKVRNSTYDYADNDAETIKTLLLT